jgi:DeoR/GlpR family transcriptional regulator of sugar metabolism
MKGAVALETLAEEEEDEDESGEVKVQDTMRKPAQKKIQVLDRSKFGKLIVNYGTSY